MLTFNNLVIQIIFYNMYNTICSLGTLSPSTNQLLSRYDLTPVFSVYKKCPPCSALTSPLGHTSHESLLLTSMLDSCPRPSCLAVTHACMHENNILNVNPPELCVITRSLITHKSYYEREGHLSKHADHYTHGDAITENHSRVGDGSHWSSIGPPPPLGLVWPAGEHPCPAVLNVMLVLML